MTPWIDIAIYICIYVYVCHMMDSHAALFENQQMAEVFARHTYHKALDRLKKATRAAQHAPTNTRIVQTVRM